MTFIHSKQIPEKESERERERERGREGRERKNKVYNKKWRE